MHEGQKVGRILTSKLRALRDLRGEIELCCGISMVALVRWKLCAGWKQLEKLKVTISTEK
jgi:hypothetical protein